jgi:hypothetical protein
MLRSEKYGYMPLVVAAMTASRRLRRVGLILSFLLLSCAGIAYVAGYYEPHDPGAAGTYFVVFGAFLGGLFLLMWLIASILAWIARIVAEDVNDSIGTVRGSRDGERGIIRTFPGPAEEAQDS